MMYGLTQELRNDNFMSARAIVVNFKLRPFPFIQLTVVKTNNETLNSSKTHVDE